VKGLFFIENPIKTEKSVLNLIQKRTLKQSYDGFVNINSYK